MEQIALMRCFTACSFHYCEEYDRHRAVMVVVIVCK